jgi:hypothetical protein
LQSTPRAQQLGGCHALTLRGGDQLLTNVQPGWYVQAVGLSDAQGVGVPVQVVAGPDHPEQSSCWPHVV